ncbi:MAG: tripartite tricarboxylate transporter substrate binding protein [Acidisphaera sp.]|nr:tripartite tricarboxylate transporter substrate binding protein [Acidisphaera sp.]
MRRRDLLLGATAAMAGSGRSFAQGAWKPDHPVTIIVPWAAGGSTDQCVRVVASELQAALGQSCVVVNQPGASGSIGTRNVLAGPHDGYTWASGAAADLGCYKVLGLLDTSLDDWNLYLAIANVSVICANPSSPYKDFAAFFAAMTKPGGTEVPVATAGISSAGQLMMEMLRAATKGAYRHVPYDGGNPAVIAAVAGETPIVSCLLVEAGDMIKAKRLVPLAALADKPVPLAGYGAIPPITQWVPGMAAPLNYFGIWLPKDAPAEVHATMQQAWQDRIASSKALRDYAERRAALFTPLAGQPAHDEAMKLVRQAAWLYYDGGKAKVSPDTVGISRA